MALYPGLATHFVHPKSLGPSLFLALLREVVLLLKEVALDLGVLEQKEVPFCTNVSIPPRLHLT